MSPASFFKRFDANSDGKLTKEEAEDSDEENLIRNFATMDSDNNGEVSEEEFSTGMNRAMSGMGKAAKELKEADKKAAASKEGEKKEEAKEDSKEENGGEEKATEEKASDEKSGDAADAEKKDDAEKKPE